MSAKLPWLLYAGGVFLAGLLLMWRVSRYDIKGMLWDSAFHVALRRRTRENPTPIEAKLAEIAAADTHTGKAKRLAATAIGHFVAQVLSIVALVLMAVGALLAAYAIFFA